MPKIFISYRRDDSEYQADKLHKALEPYVADPKNDIFIDIDNVPFGIDFVEHLEAHVGQCQVLLALIGRRWLDVVDADTGVRRLDEPEDFVRNEIAAAMRQGIKVVPVLLDGAKIPRDDQLPEVLHGLSRRNGIPINRISFDSDVERLVRGLGLLSTRTRRRAFWAAAVLVAVVGAGGGGIALWRGASSGSETDEQKDAPQNPASIRRADSGSHDTLLGAALISDTEPFEAKPVDQGGFTFIGFGHLLEPGDVKHGSLVISGSGETVWLSEGLTRGQALALLDADMQRIDAVIDALVTAPLTRSQRGALQSFIYQTGTRNFESSTLLKKINRGESADAPAEFAKWTKIDGVVKPELKARRDREIMMWTAPS